MTTKNEHSQVESLLIAAGVRNLKEFGYPSVTPENIITDAIYSEFFKRMLEDDENKGKGVKKERESLLAKIKAATKSQS